MNWKYISIYSVLINNLTIIYFNIRQLKTCKNIELPIEFKNHSLINEKEFKVNQKYGFNYRIFKTIVSIYNLGINLFFIIYLYPYVWNYANEIAVIDNNPLKEEIVATLLFFSFISFVKFLINLPISYYTTFVLGDEFNGNNLKLFIQDIILGFIFSVILKIPLITASITIIRSIDFRFCWVYCTIIEIFCKLFIDIIYPSLFKPIFLPNEFKQIIDGELKESIIKLCNNVGYESNNGNGDITIYISQTTSEDLDKLNLRTGKQHINIYCSSLFNKHIVLYQSLINKYDNDEILAMIAHEISHVLDWDEIWNLLIPICNTGLFLYLLNHFLLNDMAFLDFNINTTSLYMGLLLFNFIYQPVNTVFESIQNHFIKNQVYNADLKSQQIMECNQFATLFKIMVKENNPVANNDYYYSLLCNPIPTYYQRFKNLEFYLSKNNNKKKNNNTCLKPSS